MSAMSAMSARALVENKLIGKERDECEMD